jgi:cellulose biosynthesis protein BcsQ/tetratricopeptide (TPR) repeat protein
MTGDRNGKIVTFYSYKGGTGRTMALANVAWILAANGKRVLVVDWDLESPALDRFFAPFLNPAALASTAGVIELIREYEWAATRRLTDAPWPEHTLRHDEYATVHKYSFPLSWDQFPSGAALDFLSAGRHNRDYAAALNLNWDDFYGRLGGGAFFDALRADMTRNYDYTLIDSRSGLNDLADICTLHLPDILVDCFTLSEQGIAGARLMADIVRSRSARAIRILPVPMRVDPAEKRKADDGRRVARQRLAGLPDAVTDVERETYWALMQIPYQAFYGYEETLATFADSPGSPGSLLTHYELLTRYLTGGEVTQLPAMDDGLRRRLVTRFGRWPDDEETQVVLQYDPIDQVWAEWLTHVLTAADVRVLDGGGDHAPASARLLAIVSRADAAVARPGAGYEASEPLIVYVADVPPPLAAPAQSVRIAGLDEAAAAAEVRRLVGRSTAGTGSAQVGPRYTGPRYPGAEPPVFQAPPRNLRFTGRDTELCQLRDHLRAGNVRGADDAAIVIQGMSGLGKTHLALEYAHRYRGAYDAVLWITADAPIDQQLSDLAAPLGVPGPPGGETARAVLAALGRGEPYSRWLLVYDDTEEACIESYLPPGRGHVLITSRTPQWTERAVPLTLDVFDRGESVALLRRRNPGLVPDDAGRVAEALGDLPLAVAATAAWLAETGMAPAAYLEQIERLGPAVITLEPAGATVADGWNTALDQLAELSPAASRLLQLCCVLGPEIALELVHSDALARFLAPVDPAVSDRIRRAALVQQLGRLALIRIDQLTPVGEHAERGHGGRIVVHRLLAALVRARLSPDELVRTRHEMHQVLAALRPDGEVDDPATWPRLGILWPHLAACGAVDCTDEEVRGLLIDRVRYLWLRGDLARAEQQAQQTEAAWTRALDGFDLDGRQALEVHLHQLRASYANILRHLGRFDEAYALDEQTLAAQLDVHGPDHPYPLVTAGGLAGDLRALGRYRQAVARDEETHQAWVRRYGADHPRTLAARAGLATSYRLVGRAREARDADEYIYQGRRRLLGDAHPRTLLSLGNLGRDLRDTGEYDRSVALLRTLVELGGPAFGHHSRYFGLAQANLATSLRCAGWANEAAALFDEAVERLRERQGPASPDSRSVRLGRAVNLLAWHEPQLAQAELRDLREGYATALGEHHPHTLACDANLVVVDHALTERAATVPAGRAVVEALAEMLGPTHPYTLESQANLAIYLAEAEEPRLSRATFVDALHHLTEVCGAEHPVTLTCRANLSVLALIEERHTDVEHSRVLGLLARAVGRHHPAVAELGRGAFVCRAIEPHPF